MSVTLDKKASRILLDQTSGTRGKTIFVDPATGTDASGVDGKTWSTPKATITAALALAVSGDRIVLAPGQYNETVTIPASKPNITIVGMGGRGAAYIEPETAGAEGMEVLADDVTLINVGIAGEETSDYALKVGSQTVSPARFRAYDCKFERGYDSTPSGTVVLLKGAGDVLMEDCEYAYGDSGILFDDNDDGFCTQIKIVRPYFHNLVAVHVGLETSGGVLNLGLLGGIHDNMENGTAPTDYIKVDRAGDTGLIDDCTFASATISAAKMTIAAGIKWGGGNRSEAGYSTARPA